MENILKVKLYGEGFKTYKIKINQKFIPIFEETAFKLKEPLHSALLNVNFFSLLNLTECQGLKDIVSLTIGGLINNNKNQVEITLGRKRIAKFQIEELFRPKTLFPLFNTQMNEINTIYLNDGLYIMETEIGLIGALEIEVTGQFQIDFLKFHLSNIKISHISHELLTSITYKDENLKFIKSDSLLRNQICINLK